MFQNLQALLTIVPCINHYHCFAGIAPYRGFGLGGFHCLVESKPKSKGCHVGAFIARSEVITKFQLEAHAGGEPPIHTHAQIGEAGVVEEIKQGCITRCQERVHSAEGARDMEVAIQGQQAG